jgi:hypothetical protein
MNNLDVSFGRFSGFSNRQHIQGAGVSLTKSSGSELWHAFGLVWFGLYVHPFSHTCNIGHVNDRLQFTTQFIIYGHPHNTI